MSKNDFQRYIAKMGTHRLFGMSPQDFLETMPERRWTRRNGEMQKVHTEPYRGITTDGEALSDLYSLRPEGAPTEAILSAVAYLYQTLTPEQTVNVNQPIDSSEKNGWQNGMPDYGNHGLRLDEVSLPVRESVLAILKASLSAKGYERARNTMRLNGYLGELVGAPLLLTEWGYRFHFYGEPSTTEPWGWQLSGHHLCLTAFFLGTQMTMTPTFMGVEPNQCMEGQFAGASVFMDEEYNGLKLGQSLSDSQRKKAIIGHGLLAEHLPEGRHHPLDGLALGGAYQDNRIVPYEGIRGGDLSAAQWNDLMDLAESYLNTMPEGPLREKMRDVEKHKADTHFCWAGGLENDSVFYYRIQSPVTMIEFDHHHGVVLDNPTPERFHIHTIVRTPNGNDYGLDLLRLHYQQSGHHEHAHDSAGHGHAHDHSHEHTHSHGHGAHGHTHDPADGKLQHRKD